MANVSTKALNYDMVIYVDEKTSATNGGDFTIGDWRTRDLNTERYSQQSKPWSSLSTNQVTLQPGSYFVKANAPAYDATRHIIRFQNVTDGTTAITGSSEFENNGDQTQTRSFVIGGFDINVAKTFELQHQCTATKTGNGFGVASLIATNTYSILQIVKLK